MPLCQVCMNDDTPGRSKERPLLEEGERCSRCNRTPAMEAEDLEVDLGL